MFARYKRIVLAAGIILLLLLLVLVSFYRQMADDLTFDFLGYSLRTSALFDGWTNQFGMGAPGGTFNQLAPLFLPVLLKAVGIGAVTLPVALSLLIVKLFFPIAFLQLKKAVKADSLLLVLFGLFFVLNPITFNFLNRFLELTGWLFFVIAFSCFFSFLSSKEFPRKYFALSVLFSSATILSHTIPAIFLFLSFAFLSVSKSDFKKALFVGAFSVGLAAVWLLPFVFFSNYSVLSLETGGLSAINTFGVQVSGAFLLVALFFSVIVSWKIDYPQKPWLHKFLFFTFLLAILKTFFPSLPVISSIFAHSFDVFFIFGLLVFAAVLFERKLVKNWHLALSAVLCLALVLVAFPSIERQYSPEPRFGTEKFFEMNGLFDEKGNLLSLQKIDAVLGIVPKGARAASLPAVTDFLSFEAYRLGFGVVDDYAFFPLKYCKETQRMFNEKNIDCNLLDYLSEKTATGYWLALDRNSAEKLLGCGFLQMNSELPSLFRYARADISFVENGSLLSIENKRVLLVANPPKAVLKVNYFPRWTASTVDGKRIEIRDAMPGIEIPVEKTTTVELHYGNSIVDFAGIIISAFSVLALFLAFFFLNRNGFEWERVSSDEKSRKTAVFREHLERYKFAARFVKGKRVLDAASGTGYGSELLSESGAASVVGIDKGEKAVEFSREHYKKAVFFEADVKKTGFPDANFDVIVSFETIEHLRNYEKFLSEAARLLKKNCVFIVSTPNSEVRRNIFSSVPNNPFHEIEFSESEFKRLLGKHFEKVEIFCQQETAEKKPSLLKIIADAVIALDFLKIRKYFIGLAGEKARRLMLSETEDDFRVKKPAKGKKYFTFIAVCRKKN